MDFLKDIISKLPFPIAITIGAIILFAWIIKEYHGWRNYGQVFRNKFFIGVVIAIIIITVSITSISFMLKESAENRKTIAVDIYQIGEANYGIDILKYLILTINETQQGKSLHFRFFDRQNSDIINFINTKEKNYNHVLTLLKKIHVKQTKSSRKSVAIAFVPFSLYSNLFSVATDGYGVISTFDWNFPEFQPPSVYEYMFYSLSKTALVSASFKSGIPIKYHEKYATYGCIFDYKYEKRDIRNEIYQPSICDFHKKAIVDNFGQSMLNDIQHILSFSWFRNENVLKDLKELHEYQFFDSTLTKSNKQNKGLTW